MRRDQSDAEIFAEAWMKGRKDGLRVTERYLRRLRYAQKRVARLARWRRYAIERLAIGPELLKEIDREAKRS